MNRTSITRLLLGLSVCAIAWGQASSTINGSVTDPSGAVAPGAKITLTEIDTSLARTTISNADGLYVLSSLRPTGYTLRVQLAGC